MADELYHLFSNVPGIMGQLTDSNGATSQPTSDGLAAFPEHGGVTDEQIATWLQQRQGQRIGPPPLVSGQNAPAQPQFLPGQGQHTPPPGGMEGAEGGGNAQVVPGRTEPTSPQQPQQQPQPTAPVSSPTGFEQQPPSPTGSPTSPQPGPSGGGTQGTPVPATPPADYVEFNGQQIPRTRLEAWINFQKTLDGDAELQNLLARYQTGQLRSPVSQPPSPQPYPGYPPVPQYGQPQPQSQPTYQPGPFTPPQYSVPPGQANLQPQLPQLTAEDLQDPAIANIYQMLQYQQQQIATATQAATAAQEVAITRAQQEQAAAVERVAAEYQTANNLTPEQMQQVYGVAARLQIVPTILSGIDPVTNLPCPRDTAFAVKRAFDIASSQIPELQSRQQQQVITQFQADENKQSKLTALAGGGGSAPRSTPAPRNAAERATAMKNEIAAMLNGTWNSPEN